MEDFSLSLYFQGGREIMAKKTGSKELTKQQKREIFGLVKKLEKTDNELKLEIKAVIDKLVKGTFEGGG